MSQGATIHTWGQGSLLHDGPSGHTSFGYYLLLGQGVYYLISGLWPLVSIHTFHQVTGPKRMLRMVARRWLGLIALAVLAVGTILTACAGGASGQPSGSAPASGLGVSPSPAVTPAARQPERSPRPPSEAEVSRPPRTPGPAVTITGRVKAVAASARVIDFEEPVHGFSEVALLDETQIVGADGSRRSLQDIRPGTVIQASGAADGHGGILARTIRIVS